MRRILDVTAGTLTAFVQEAVEPGSTVLTDAWSGYKHLTAAGYGHQPSASAPAANRRT